MVKTAGLEAARRIAVDAPELSFPKRDPSFDLHFFFDGLADQMKMIRHQDVAPDYPAAGSFPARDQIAFDFRLRQPPSPLEGADSQKHDRGLSAKDKNAWCGSPSLRHGPRIMNGRKGSRRNW